MFIFTQTRTAIAGKENDLARSTHEWAEHAGKHSSSPIVAYRRIFGVPTNGSCVYAVFDSYASFGEWQSASRADERVAKAAAKSAACAAGPSANNFREAPMGGPQLLDLMTLDTGLAKLGRMDDAIAFGMKMAEIVGQQAQQTTAFSMDMYGSLGAMAWMTPAVSYAELDAQGKAIMGDTQYKKLMSGAPLLFEALAFDRFLDERIDPDD